MGRNSAAGKLALIAICALIVAAPDWGFATKISLPGDPFSQEQTRKRPTSSQQRSSSAQTIRRLNSQVAGLLAQNDTLRIRVAQLEAAFESFATVVPDLRNALGATVQSKAVMDSAEVALVNQLSLVLNKINLLEDKAAYIDSTNFEILTQLVLVENKIVSLATSFNDVMAARQPGQASLEATMTDEEFRSKYIKALTVYQNGQYNTAREQFALLTQSGLDHELADNAQYWLAECYYSTRNFKRAIDEFERVMTYRGTDKADHAQYKIGLSYWNAGDYSTAKQVFQKLLADYPDTSLRNDAIRYIQ